MSPQPASAPDLSPKLVETHSALLIFIGDRVYKLKKAVDLGFLDFRTPAARRSACQAEVELNRRLAPDAYLGVADVHDPSGEVCESLVVMRRMPEHRRLSTLVTTEPGSAELADALTALARLMADFHSRCATSSQIAAYGDPEAIRRLWRDNILTLRRFTGDVLAGAEVDRIEALAMAYLDGREPLLRRRQQQGRIRDGHGDLLADDIFILDDGPRVLDCLEFDPRLRFGDVLNDVAFLAMDLEQLGAPDAARTFLDSYAGFSGEHHPRSLEDHYIAYRAGVRSKVSCLRWSQGEEAAASAARAFSALAARHLTRGQVPLVLVGGLPGTGKSTVAAGLSQTPEGMAWTLLRSDVVRKELAGMDPSERAPAAYGAGLYQPQLRRRVYAQLFERAEIALGLGQGVILDATFSDDADRTAARRLAAKMHSPLVELECRAPAGAVVDRLAPRAGRHRDPSDADPEIFRAMARQATPWPAARGIDTSGTIPAGVAAARAAVMSTLEPAGRVH